MTDDRLERALSDAIAELAGTGTPDYLDDILERTSRTRQRPWWTFPGRYTIMTPTLKFAVAATLAFVLGVGVSPLILPSSESDPGQLAAETPPDASEEPPLSESEGIDTPAFPTGYFVSVGTGGVMLEFRGDGTGITHSAMLDSVRPVAYAVEGDIYTALRGPSATVLGMALGEVEPGGCGPATYRWDYDGERLAFELIGEDGCDRRKSLLPNDTFRSIEDPRTVMIASSDLDVGDPIRALLGYVSAAEADPDAYTSKTEYVGRVAAVPIAKGQPITPDLLESPAE